MANRLTDLYNADITAGDPENIVGDEILVFDPSPSSQEIKSKGMTVNQLKVIVNEPDSVGELQFESLTYSLNDSTIDVMLPINLVRLGGYTQAISVDWTLGGTATENTHYTINPIAGTIVFAEYETSKVFQLTLLAGSLSSSETVTLILTTGTFKKEGLNPSNPGVPEIVDDTIEGNISSCTIDLIL